MYLSNSSDLPPDLRFKFEIETSNTEVLIAQSTPGRSVLPGTVYDVVTNPGAPFYKFTAAGAPAINTRYRTITARALTNAMELQYPWHVLRQPVQAAISSMWLQKPFLFNYETIQITEITPQTGTKNIHFPIAISTQRPTKVSVFLLPQKTSANWVSGSALPATLYDDVATETLRVLNTPTNWPSKGITGSDTGPVLWTDLEIMFSGRTAYRLRNDLVGTYRYGNEGMLPIEVFCKLWEEQSLRSTSTEFYNVTKEEKFTLDHSIPSFGGVKSTSVIDLIIQPGGWADRGVISSRQGATTITINITFASKLASEDRFVVVRKNPEQCVFDSDKNVTLIQWPAIKNNAGYLLPDITAAP